MNSGIIVKLVHLSQQTYLPNAQLVPDHNEKGYGLIEGEDGNDVYFHHKVVANTRGFDDLRLGQIVEYALADAPYLQATSVRQAPTVPARIHKPAA
jgi:cold shock CspA family protein